MTASPEALPNVPEFGLKDKTEQELVDLLLDNEAWNQEQKDQIYNAYHIAAHLHADDDPHRGQIYIYHPLRVANRIVSYLGITDADVITAALLHDTVEDHGPELLQAEIGGRRYAANDITPDKDPMQTQQLAFGRLTEIFSPRVAELVRAVTNPSDIFTALDQEGKLEAYRAKVEFAVTTREGWAIKFSDWCDNAVGIIHSDDGLPANRLEWFKRKYGNVYHEFADRYAQDDIQSWLNDPAKNYVDQQLMYATERLHVLAA